MTDSSCLICVGHSPKAYLVGLPENVDCSTEPGPNRERNGNLNICLVDHLPLRAALAATLLTILVILSLCGCCIIPCMSDLAEQAIVKALEGNTAQMLTYGQQHLLAPEDTELCAGLYCL